MLGNLRINLEGFEDKNQQIYYLGKVKFPGGIDLNSATFLIFVSEEGEEEMQIAINDKDNIIYSKYTFKKEKDKTRLCISLDERVDQNKKIFYIAKVKIDSTVDCYEDVTFVVFTSRQGSEELQIVGNFDRNSVNLPKEKSIEIIRAPKKEFYHGETG